VFSTYFNFSLPLFHSSPFSSPLPQRTPLLSLHSFSSLSFPISSPLPSSPFSPQWRGDPRAASRPPRKLDRGPAWELGPGHPRVGARPRPSRELDCGRRRSSALAARSTPRRPSHRAPPPTLPLPSLLLSPGSSNAGSPSSLPAASPSSLTLQIRSGGGNGKLAASVAASGAASAAAVGAVRSGAVPCELTSLRCGAPPPPSSRLPLTSPPLSSPAGRD